MTRDTMPDARLYAADKDTDGDGPNCELRVQPRWALYLGKRDMMLVLRALGGRMANDEERAAAAALGDRLTILREKETAELHKGSAIAGDAVREKNGTTRAPARQVEDAQSRQ